MAAPLSSVVGIMSPGTWAMGYGLSIVPEQPGAPCDSITAVPETDNGFELRRIYGSMKPAPHIPVRGS